jgi:peptide/nickel transport system permease protein
LKRKKRDSIGHLWYKFSRNKVSVVGLAIVCTVIMAAIFAPLIAPFPEHSGAYVDFNNTNLAPNIHQLLGTDNMGRDILSRLIFSLRSALLMGVLVLAISVPIGFVLGVVAGYYKGSLLDTIIMRITDIFLSIPPLILALAIASVLEPNLTNSMIAITVMWWPWYARLAYGISSSLRTENYVIYAELTGASVFHILSKEILPNCLSSILTKMTLDMGWVIMMGASLSFVGLGEQAPKPSLGQMVADGIRYMPDQWWMTAFPALFIILIVLGFNLFGDGVSDVFTVEES